MSFWSILGQTKNELEWWFITFLKYSWSVDVTMWITLNTKISLSSDEIEFRTFGLEKFWKNSCCSCLSHKGNYSISSCISCLLPFSSVIIFGKFWITMSFYSLDPILSRNKFRYNSFKSAGVCICLISSSVCKELEQINNYLELVSDFTNIVN